MKAMILAAGFGKRLQPLTLTTPKPLVEAGGKPLIIYHIERLAQAGVKELVINTGYLGHKIQDYLGDGSQWSVEIQYSEEAHDSPLETAGGINKALPLLGQEPFLVLNADVWCDYPFEQLIQNAEQVCGDSANLAHLVLIPNPDFKEFGDFSLESGKIHEGKELTFAGISIMHPALFADMQSNIAYPLKPLLDKAIADERLSGELYQGQWFDVGTLQRLEQLNQYLASQ